MSGEGWAAGKSLIRKCGRREPKLWVPRMGDSGTGRQRQGFVTEEASVTEHLQRCEADGGGRNKVAEGGWAPGGTFRTYPAALFSGGVWVEEAGVFMLPV